MYNNLSFSKAELFSSSHFQQQLNPSLQLLFWFVFFIFFYFLETRCGDGHINQLTLVTALAITMI